MKLGRALEVVRFQRRQVGKGIHCADPTCVTCALLAIAAELEFQWDKRKDPAKPRQRPASSREFCECGLKLVDGLCSNCNG